MENYIQTESIKHIDPQVNTKITLKDRSNQEMLKRKKSEINSGNTHIPTKEKEKVSSNGKTLDHKILHEPD